MKQQHEVLGRFDDPASLLDHLYRKGEDLDEKDILYGALVRIVQARRENATLASALIWLGLWPGLDAIFRRRVRLYPNHPEELVCDIGNCFTNVVARIDFSRVKRIAATLVRGTERDVVEGRRRSWKESALRVGLPDDSRLCAVDPVELKDASPLSPFGLKGDLPDEEEVAVIRRQLLPIVGNDVDLVIGVAIYGQSQQQLGASLGLTHEAARKRFQRALQRLRRHFCEKK